MNKATLKSYAPQARKDFIAAVTARASLLGLSEKAGKLEVAASQPQGDATLIAGLAWPVKVHNQRQQLINRIQKDGFAETIEAVAYTWFNRFAALRYMELHDYLDHGHRALSSQQGTLPDILTHATELAHNGGLPGLRPALVAEMKLAGNRDGELYRLLLVAQCNALSSVMPFLFERIDDETELLLPDNLLRTDSVIANLVAAIDEKDWEEVEIIGWLYQFYISEKKDEVIGKIVKSEDIPAATQLFTPNWIVQYLVQNSVGHLWSIANPASNLKAQWPYYIAPASQAPDVQAQLDALLQTRISEGHGIINPETITMLDPACGSGHILVEAYGLFKAIYLERGYQPRSIPRLILENNLFGLDIDDRAAQMAGFALMMKARADDRRLFAAPIRLNVLSLQQSKGLDADEIVRALQPSSYIVNKQIAVAPSGNKVYSDGLSYGSESKLDANQSDAAYFNFEAIRATIFELIATFEHAKTFGSTIQISPALNSQLTAATEFLEFAFQSADLYANAAARDLWNLVAQAKILGMKYDAVVANPPYMGNKYFSEIMRTYAEKKFPRSKGDLFSMFIERSACQLKPGGFAALVTIQNWMFLSSFQAFREDFLKNCAISNLLQIGYNSFPEINSKIAQAVAFCFQNYSVGSINGTYINLNSEDFSADKNKAFLARADSEVYEVNQKDFLALDGMPVAYNLGAKILGILSSATKVNDIADAREGINTGDNSRFMRYWSEVSLSQLFIPGPENIDCREVSKFKKWFPCNKGGAYRRWYGNNDFVVDWSNNGNAIKNLRDANGVLLSRPQNTSYFFREGITWSGLGQLGFSGRYFPTGFAFNSAGRSVFPTRASILTLIGALNSSMTNDILKVLAPTLSFTVGNIGRLPFDARLENHADECVEKMISLAKLDWDATENSWDFVQLPLLRTDIKQESLAKSWGKWNVHCLESRRRMKDLEEENNRLFIDFYGLHAEVLAEVHDYQITLARAERDKDCQRLISYAVGCMMGRYSLAASGLVYANAGNVGFDAGRYASFPADADGIVPLTDGRWFEDEAASRIREFLLTIWGADTLAENMAWLAESLGSKISETPDETIRRYLVEKFYKDHLQTYKKRPIYWLFSSGKQGAFQALVYLHRYHEGTLARMRAEYVVPLTGKIQSRIDMLEKDAIAAAGSAARNLLTKEVEKLKKKHVELLAYDEQLRHHADMRIRLDLDDGVKVNYGKFGDLLAEVKAVTGGASDD